MNRGKILSNPQVQFDIAWSAETHCNENVHHTICHSFCSDTSCWTAHLSVGVRPAAGLWITLPHVWHHSLCPSLPLQTVSCSVFISLYQCIFSSFHPANSASVHTSDFSLTLFFSGLLYFSFAPGVITLSFLASHRLDSKTGASSWEVINQWKLCFRPQLQNHWPKCSRPALLHKWS